MTPIDDHPSGELPEEVVEFLVESNENLDRLDQDLLALESNPTDKERLSSIFRTIHTIKGTCGFLGFEKLESVTHVGENLLSKLRDGAFVLNPALTDALLAMVDAVREMLASIEATANDGNGDYSVLVATLSELSVNGGQAPKVVSEASAPAIEVTNVAPNAQVFLRTERSSSEVIDTEVVEGVDTAPSAVEATPAPEAPIAAPEAASKVADAPDTPVTGEAKSGVSDSSIRVDVSLLDRLMDLV
ncbi:MAG: Hpt domain-containing protein, partial [Acidimicrobiales bacterium]